MEHVAANFSWNKKNVLFLIWLTSAAATVSSTLDWKTSIDILQELAPVRLNLSGVSLAPEPFSISALYFTGTHTTMCILYSFEKHWFRSILDLTIFSFGNVDDLGDNRNIRLLETSYDKVMHLLQSHSDITFIASVRQEPHNVGTLFSLSEGFTR